MDNNNILNNLPRVQWRNGQTLLPQDFVAQEDSLLADTAVQMRLLGLPFYGVGRLAWNETLITQATLDLLELTCIFPQTGYLIKTGNNAVWNDGISSLKFSATANTVYVLLMKHFATKEDCSCVSDLNTTVAREYYVVKLSTEKDDPCAIDCLKLAVFEKGMKGWNCSRDYIPPLLSANPKDTPFLTDMIYNLQNQLKLFAPVLQQSIVASYISGERKFAAQQCLFGVSKLENFLQNLQQQLHLHPYYFYTALMDFYLCLFLYLQKSNLDAMKQMYKHNDLATTLNAFITPIMNNLNPDYPIVPVYEEFVLEEEIYQISPLPQQLQCAKEIYLLIQKESSQTVLCMKSFRIASLEHLPSVIRYSTRGIPYKSIAPTFPNPFGSEVDFYLLEDSTELQKALRDNSLGFYKSDQPAGMTSAAIYWR